MKIKVAVSMFAIQVLVHGPVFAGGSIGGSGPPAKEILEPLLMMSRETGAAGLFETDLGEIKLGVNRELTSDLVLSKAKLPAKVLAISAADFDTLATSKGNIEAMTIGAPQPEIRSYAVEDGDKLGELRLRDRRERARSSVK